MAFGDNMEWVRGKDGVVRKRKSRKPGSIYGSGSTGAFAHEDLPEEGPYESLAELALGDKVKEKMSTALGGSTSKTGLKPETGIWASLKNLFGGSSSNDDETKEKGTGTDWGKWLTFAKGIMDWNTSNKEIELGREQNRLGRDQLGFKRAAYAGEVERKDTEYYDQVDNVNQQRKFLNLWLDKQGREADRVGYLKNKNYSLPA